MKYFHLLMICLITFHSTTFSQMQQLIDSLQIDLRRLKDEKKAAGIPDTTMRDTYIIFTLTRLGIAHLRDNPDSSLSYASQVVDMSQKIDFTQGLSDAYSVLGVASKKQGNYSAAIDYYTRSIQMKEVLKDSLGLAVTYANLGEVNRLKANYLPAEVAEELKAKGSAQAKHIDLVTVLFTDIIGFTEISARMSAGDLVDEINACFSGFDRIIQEHGIEKIKTIGDSYMAAGGLPTPNISHPVDVVSAAMAMQRFMKERQAARMAKGQTYFEIRLGVHTGPVVAGIVGVKKFQYDIWGDTVNTASGIESAGQAGMVNISHTTYEYVKDKFTCTRRGNIQIKGKGEVEMYFVEGVV